MSDFFLDDKFSEGDFYPGIYNYCDRWCERCRFNSRCLNYSFEMEMEENQDEAEVDDSILSVKMIFEEISEMLEQFMEKEGIVIEDLPEIDEEAEKEVELKVEKNGICVLADKYNTLVHEWFADNNSAIEQFVVSLRKKVEIGSADGDPVDDILSLHDVIDIIIFYYSFIYIKLRRAVRDIYDEIFDKEFKELDKNLSAKLALIGIDRSIDAWRIMSEIIEERADLAVNQFADMLENLREKVETDFPDARDFVRPYFDEGE